MKIVTSIGALVLFVSLSFPLSAGAFGRSPSSSEVNQTGTVKTAVATSDPTKTPQAVPEPSSATLFAVAATGIVAIVVLKRRRTHGS